MEQAINKKQALISAKWWKRYFIEDMISSFLKSVFPV